MMEIFNGDINVFIVMLFILAIVMLIQIKKINKQDMFLIAYFLCEKAEVLFNEPKSGTKKKEYVINKLYNFIPKPIRFIVSEKELSDIVENALETLKEEIKMRMENVNK
jgi:hypothetical protein